MVLGFQFPQWAHAQHRCICDRCRVVRGAILASGRDCGNDGWCAVEGMVATSRLVLGVHWPSEVLVAMCLGAFIPLLISVANDLHLRNPGNEERSG